MNTYEFAMGEWPHERTETEIALTASKARYQLYRKHADCYESFWQFLFDIRSTKLIHKFTVSDLFGDREKFNHTKNYRNIEFAEIGMRIEVDGMMGTICGSNRSANLDVCFDGQYWTSNCHPWWMTKYFDKDGKVIAEYGD